LSDGAHACFSADTAHISSVEIFAEFGNCFEVEVTLLADVLSVNFQNFKAASLVWQWDLNLAVHTARSQQCRVKLIGSVGRHHALNSAEVIETVKLVEQLHKGSLNFTIGRATIIKSFTTNGIDLINENDARLIVFGVGKHFPDRS